MPVDTITYTYTGGIEPNNVGGAIYWINNEINNKPLVRKLYFYLSSNGGDVDSAIRLYDFLKSLPIKVIMISFGQIDSAANTVYLAGEERISITNCRFFLHEGTFTMNQASALHVHEESLIFLKELLRRTTEIISKETKKEFKEIQKILRDGTLLNTEEAKKFGIVHKIVDKLPKLA
ncbi:MAG: ATP-dependent Clp protease proteolytic subunit [Patescibacteria group bacterium]